MPEDDVERWIKLAEWRGKTYQALEDINKELIEIKSSIKDGDDITHKRIAKLEGKVDDFMKDVGSYMQTSSKESGILSGKMVIVVALIITIVGNILGNIPWT